MSFFRNLGHVVGNIGKTVVKAAKDTEKAVVKGAVDAGHVAGEVATSSVGKTVLGVGLAIAGAPVLAAAGVGAGVEAAGQLVKKGGNLKKAITVGAVQGAVTGAAGATVGAGVRAVKNGTGFGGFKSQLLGGKNAPFPHEVHPTDTDPVAHIGPVDQGDAPPPTPEVGPTGQMRQKKLALPKVPDLTHVTVAPHKITPVDTHIHSAHNGPIMETAPPEILPLPLPVAGDAAPGAHTYVPTGDSGGSGGGGGGSIAPVPASSHTMMVVAAVVVAVLVIVFAAYAGGRK